MRGLLMATTVLALVATGDAAAQRVVAHGPSAAPLPAASRWGSRIDGRWWGGTNAPGGWAAYRRPDRGWVLPPYWAGPRFGIADWRGYGLRAPGPGYRWVRYYDDAVLIDDRGLVADSAGGVDWDGAARALPPVAARDDGFAYDGPAVQPPLVAPPPPPPPPRVVTVERRRMVPVAPHHPPLPPYPPVAPDDLRPAPPPPLYPPVARYDAPPPAWVSPDGRTTVTTTSVGGFGGGSTTTVVVQSAPVVTTTTTDYFTDEVTYVRPRPATRIVHKRVWRARPACRCR